MLRSVTIRRDKRVRLLLDMRCASLLAVAAVLMLPGVALPAVAAPNAGREGVDARVRPRAEPLPLPPDGRELPAPDNRGADEERDDAPHGPSGCPDRGQPLELIV